MVLPGRNQASRPSWADDSWEATVLHIDMDAFFLSVELLDRPELIDKAAVVAEKSGRSVVTSASYEARKYGVHSAMPVSQALALCPQLVIVEPTRAKYSEASGKIMDVLHGVTPLVEQLSIDEAFLDVAGARRRLGTPAQIAMLIKERVRQATGLPSTVGVAATKSVAKIASDHSKPDGIGVVPVDQTAQYLAPLPVNVIWGVGPKLHQRLTNADIHTVGALASQDPKRMRRWLGALGSHIVELARGYDPRSVETEHETKSVSVEHTFEHDISCAQQLEKYLLDLSYECSRRLRNDGFVAWGLSVKVKDSDFTTRTKSISLKAPATSGAVFFDHTRRLLHNLLAQRPHPVRLLGVRADKVAKPAEPVPTQGSLFDMNETELHQNSSQDWYSTDKILDDVAKRFPNAAIKPATLLQHERPERMSDG
ncbi:MAG TPA: DNA polymerase IV [Candidatus Yaniella excrementigallinarum]|nr:DNA polymerase IV [Candidatus Yaniella excrementigallinarum]